MNVDLSSFKPLYIKTAREYLLQMKKGLESLTEGNRNPEIVSQIHIAAHSLNSQSQIMGYTQIAGVCSAVEHVFKTLKDAPSKTIAPDQVKRYLTTVGALQKAVDAVENGAPVPDLSIYL